ncbi:hypothetical protein [Gordonia sp. 852002-51296_SCH5728562-b]|uniref:hypothetical protein n=1 Tax=Gordonia sp. 852002-51296_SCH5728562-b TaxID=1834101 RepID=UPI0007E95CBC|nr:hypothetical protein [Gordonia sp. 852002-51296_SCH5728562-b]OBA30276.1 hypothetical protein A5766_15940 [Gordonia sp. 852002-51296_SCH5728562-b]
MVLVSVEPLVVDPVAASAMVGKTVKTLANWRAAGVGPPFVRLGDGGKPSVAYRVADLERWIAAHVVVPDGVCDAIAVKYAERELWYVELDRHDTAYDYYSGWLCGYRAALLGVVIPDEVITLEHVGWRHGAEAAVEGGPIPRGVAGIPLDLDDLDAWVSIDARE